MTINVNGPDGITVRFPDGTDTETINKAMTERFGGTSKAEEPSGTMAAIGHAAKELIHGNAETAKQLGIGEGKDLQPDGYVPANLTNGSINPLNWNWSQAGQKIAENAPGLTQDALAGAAAKAVLGKLPVVGPYAPLAGSALSALLRTGGDTVKAVADKNGDAEPTLGDKARGFGTAALASAAGALAPTRFIPGANNVATVGTQGVLDSIKNYLATTAIGAGSSAASDAVNQLGVTGTYDPAKGIEATAGGAITSGALAAPRGAGDAIAAARRAEMGGANAQATAAYANRLLQNAGQEGLGNAGRDYAAQENTKAGLKKELQQIDASGMSQDTANALALAKTGKPLTNEHVEAIEAAHPEAGFLARQLRMAQLSEDIGSYDTANQKWSGGLSGMADKYAMRPFKNHLLIGSGLTAAGAHAVGAYSLPALATLAGGYGLARGVDNLTGARSPAAASAARFADANVPTRMAPPSAAPPPAPPQVAPQGPWGPKPLLQQSVPQVQPAAPAAPPAPQPQLNPVAMAMLKQQLKQPPAAPEPQPAPAPAAPPITPGTAPWKAPTVTELPQFNTTALKMLAGKLKANEAAQPPSPPPAPPAPPKPPTPIDPNALPSSVTKGAKNIMNGYSKVAGMKEDALQPTGEPASVGAAAAPKTMADILNNVTQAAALKSTIKKTAGSKKVNVKPGEQPAAPTPYEPIPEEELYPKGISAHAYGIGEAAKYKAKGSYAMKAAASGKTRIDTETALVAAHPKDAAAIRSLVRQLHVIGTKPEQIAKAVAHYAAFMTPEGAADTLKAFK